MRRTRWSPALLLGLVLLAACGQAQGAATQQGPQGQGQGQPSGECNKGNKPGEVTAVKTLVVDDSTVDVIWIPPSSDGCFDKFTITAKDAGTGKALETKSSSDGLRVTYSGLTPGATYEFSVTANGPAGSGGGASARAALPPSTLDVTPEAPESLTSVAVAEDSASLTWALPAGNPKVDVYDIQAVPVNATGFPTGGQNISTQVGGDTLSTTVQGLQPGGNYVFVVNSKSKKGTSKEPAVSFQRMPLSGETPPAAPTDLYAVPAGPGAVALKWNPPTYADPDFYQLGITELDASGNALGDTNVIPYKNTTAVIRDLTPGSTYQLTVQSYSTAYDAGDATGVAYTVPTDYAPPQDAPQYAPNNLQANVVGNEVQLAWEPVDGAGSYMIIPYDSYSGRSLGIQYTSYDASIAIDGLPLGQAIDIVVQAVNGDSYSDPTSVTVEIPMPTSPETYGYYGYDYNYSPYAGYNPYMPYWYSNYYPVGWYNYWYPGKWIINGIANVLNPFNHFWGAGWWYYRPWINPLSALNPWRPYRPYWRNNWGGYGGWGYGGWGWGGNRGPGLLNRPVNLPNRLPGQLGRPTTRPTQLPAVKPGAGWGSVRPNRPSILPGNLGGGGGLTRPSIPNIPTTRPNFPNTGPSLPTTRPSFPNTGPSLPTTRPSFPNTGPSLPTTRPSFPSTGPMTRPAMPGPSGGFGGGGAGGFGRPAVTRPAPRPMARPAGGAMPMMMDRRGRL
ncbi:hypothetical protein Rsub_00781 [Raphidocelis subcapitata]|uniref:Fibronectin type-III domain-containing protein n=1 Tax=Raphidocelis subcapitata TaxID=307507 RepID=A0A2V0NLS3_9CHLO|nr:hypothetical protein Rsub_00781 [Raphidocelis subcapitata]|eukprot:GBF88069.1 hypothetical protein Rsub_00781 [Raphidocelis subcapitata]